MLRALVPLLFFLLCFASAGSAQDVLTLAYSANSWGEYDPCPT